MSETEDSGVQFEPELDNDAYRAREYMLHSDRTGIV